MKVGCSDQGAVAEVHDALAEAPLVEQLELDAREGGQRRLASAARVNPYEADFFGNQCVVVSSWGSLIHATVGKSGGVGILRTKRSGWAA